MTRHHVYNKENLPDTWKLAAIGEIAEVNFRDPALRELPDDLEVTFVPMAAVDEVRGEITEPEIRTLGETKRGYTPFSEDDVLFAKITPSMENGKAAVARNLRNGRGFGSTEFHVLSAKSRVLPEWLFYYVRQEKFRQDAKANFSGTAGQLRVGTDFVAEYPIPVAPRNEQKRIIDEIETQFSRLDQAVASLERLQRSLERYKASVLKAACEGRLVPQDPDDEPAGILLDRILSERRRQWEEQEWQNQIERAQKKVAQARRKAAGLPYYIRDLEPEDWEDIPEEEYASFLPKGDKWKKKYKEPEGPDVEGLGELPAGWVWATIQQLTTRVVDGAHHTPTYTDSGVPFISVKDVANGAISFDDCKYISREEHSRLTQRCNPEIDDILITKSGTIGRTAVIKTEREFSLFVSVALLKTLKGFFRQDYFRLALDYYISRIDIQQEIKGGIIKNFHLEDLRKTPIILPPFSAQAKIVEEYERLNSVVKVLEEMVVGNLRRTDRLRQSILQKAFTGQLVPQTLEPAIGGQP